MTITNNISTFNRFLYYVLYFALFFTAQSLCMWGAYVTLPYQNLSYFESLKMALPYAWADWFFMTFAVDIGHRYNLVTPTQDTFLLIITQFVLVLIINEFYLKKKIYRSDIIAFFVLMTGYMISFLHIISGFTNPKPEIKVHS